MLRVDGYLLGMTGPMIYPNKSICLVIADTREHDEAIKVIEHNCSMMHFDQVLFFTDRDYTLDSVTIIKTPIIKDRDQYSRLILTQLAPLIETDYALVTQCDGFIYNAGAWSEKYLDFDYVGAPWWYYPFNHVPPHPLSTPSTCVGNGGFSLRSTKLINYVHEFTDDRIWSCIVPEDLFICRTLRPHLEERGMKWAPEYWAHRFCCEDRPYEGQFGIHGHQTLELNKDIRI